MLRYPCLARKDVGGSALEIRLTEAALNTYGPMFSDPDFVDAFERDGYLFLAGPGERDGLFEAWQLQLLNGVPTEWLDREALRDRYPFMDLSGISGDYDDLA